jgi:Txe/YoeB family toxin of Txe-Axe toxin-antitoxin module
MKPPKTIRVILQDQAREEYELLSKLVEEQKKSGKTNSEEIQLLKSINNKVAILKYNPTYGQSVSKELIPKTLDLDNLFRLELTHYWRMLYTIRTNEVEIVSFVLYIVDHKTYNKLLGYKDR